MAQNPWANASSDTETGRSQERANHVDGGPTQDKTGIRTRSEPWKNIGRENKLTGMKASTHMFNNKLLVRLVEYAISDSGTTGHFLIRAAR